MSQNLNLFGEILHACEACNIELTKDSLISHEGKYYCEDCFNDNFFTCDICDGITPRNYEVYIESEDIYVCDNCYHDNYITCDDCGQVIGRDDGIEACGEDGSRVIICDDCRSSDYCFCEDCDVIIHSSISHLGNNDRVYCGQCIDYNLSSRYVNPYGYEPFFHFYKNTKCQKNNYFTGFELETDDHGADIEYIAQRLVENYSFLYLQEDCTCSAFEITSHPFSKQFFLSYKDMFSDILKDCRNNGLISHNGDSCGLHISIDKKEFTFLDLYKILLFGYYNRTNLIQVSRRTEHSFNTWARVDNNFDTYIQQSKDKTGHTRGWLNLIKTNVVEFRLFRGTLKDTSFFSAFEFIYSLIDYVKNNSMNNIYVWRNFTRYILNNRKDNKNLIPYLEERNLISSNLNDGRI